MNYIELAIYIDKFINEYAIIKPDYISDSDIIEDKYTSPDVYDMVRCSELLKQNINPEYCFSSWESGGYKPYLSKEGKLKHSLIITNIKNLNNGK